MRLSFWGVAAFLVWGANASPVREESSVSVDVAEKLSFDGSHFIVSVQRTDDVREESGAVIAEKVSNIVFDFKVDQDAETLLINGYALQLIPQQVRKLTLSAAVIPPDHPALQQTSLGQNFPGSVKSKELVDALNRLERNGMVTADVDLFVAYEGDMRHLSIRIRVVEVEGRVVTHKDLLTAEIVLPRRHGRVSPPPPQGLPPTPHVPATPKRLPEKVSCKPSDWRCRIGSFLKSVGGGKGCGGRAAGRPGAVDSDHRGPLRAHHRGGHDGHRHPHGDFHRHRFHRPRRGFMRFIISVVIPVIIGAAAGIGIGILSVFVAEVIGGIIMRIRGRQPEYSPIDKKGYDGEEDVDELPVYEEMEGSAPEYTEREDKKQ